MLSLGKIRACLPAAWRSAAPKQIIAVHGKPGWHRGVWWMSILPQSRKECLWEVRNTLQWKLPTHCIKFTTKWPSRALKSRCRKRNGCKAIKSGRKWLWAPIGLCCHFIFGSCQGRLHWMVTKVSPSCFHSLSSCLDSSKPRYLTCWAPVKPTVVSQVLSLGGAKMLLRQGSEMVKDSSRAGWRAANGQHGDRLLCCNYEGWPVNCCYLASEVC